MLALVAILLFPLLFLLGTGVTRILYGNKGKGEFFWEDRFLAGIILLIGLAEGAHLGTLARGQSISVFKNLFLIAILAVTAFCVAILAVGRILQKRKGLAGTVPAKNAFYPDWKGMDKTEKVMTAVILAVFLGLLSRILFFSAVYQGQDLTLETVMSFLHTGKLYEVNPMTGAFYEQGVPSRLKLLCLSTLYAGICSFTKAGAETVVWHFVPAITLAACYFAYGSLARALFPKVRKQRLQFLLLVSILLAVGDYAYGMESFGLLHVGFQGTSIRAVVLMPYLISLCLRRKWKLAVCVVAAEACVTWTLYGLGAGVMVILIFAISLGGRKALAGRREGSAWKNS